MTEDEIIIQFSDEEYKKAAKDYKKSFLMMPVLAAQNVLKYMTGMGGCRYKVALPTIAAKVGFGPYDPKRKATEAVDAKFRELEVFLGSVITDFDPNAYVQTLLGMSAGILGDAQKEAPSAKLVIAAVMKSLGEQLALKSFTAVRNPQGTETKDLFNGWLTIINKEIEAGKISVDEGNLFNSGEKIDAVNACDILKAAERSCDPVLKEKEKFLYCAPEVKEAYEDCYLATHNATPYNKQFNQIYLEGSNNLTTIIPLAPLAGQTKAIITPKANMIYGFDNMSQLEKVNVDRFSSFLLTLSAAMFFGCEFYSIDKKLLNVIELSGN